MLRLTMGNDVLKASEKFQGYKRCRRPEPALYTRAPVVAWTNSRRTLSLEDLTVGPVHGPGLLMPHTQR